VVFLPSLRILPGEDPAAAAAARQAGALAALPVLRQFAAAGARIVFEAPTPVFPSAAFRCADFYDRHNPVCLGDTVSRQSFEALRAPILQVYQQFSQQIASVSVWDPAGIICDSTTCYQFRAGRPLLFDDNHLSGHADALLLPSFLAFITKLETTSN
jgi:hypothetical protein